tara:strand:- start:406 stop:843 length:438 start_codon:yes stop_codon:yes gene_type:complete
LKPNRKGILVASFMVTEDPDILMSEVEYIVNNLELTNNYIFLLQQKDNPEKKILTYNTVPKKGQPFNSRLYTIRIHRKKQTNTLYTINALNAAVAQQHDGKKGKDLPVDWEPYRNSLLLTQSSNLSVNPIEVVKIFKIEEPPEEN